MDLRQLLATVVDSDVVILFQTASWFTRPWVLLEIHAAITNDVPIVCVRVADGPFAYNFEAAQAFLEDCEAQVTERAGIREYLTLCTASTRPKTKGDLSQYEVLGVKPCGTRLEIRKGGNSAVRLPKILVLNSGLDLSGTPCIRRCAHGARAAKCLKAMRVFFLCAVGSWCNCCAPRAWSAAISLWQAVTRPHPEAYQQDSESTCVVACA